ncbi:MAG: DUF58 domain-containing protein [Clostridium sp.]|nr:DUF58 domain-containing protein [Clostridium sp.]MCM1170834.1 DUF58 domain-containing protein [Clostridium sp.]MCM1208435.1 DUF58 domain-containing protein [Ruminococcus sp.]
MKMKYVSKIQTNIKNYKMIPANKPTTCVLDGSYTSVFKGKSLNFDELREYAFGDDVKDIDWKSTARSGKVLVRQFIAEKKHNIMFAFDTNRRMLANSEEAVEKKELAIMAAGTLALLVNRNNDFISSIYKTAKGWAYSPFRTGLGNIELMLEGYGNAATMENHTDINDTLSYIARNFKRQMILIIVTDLEGLSGISDANLRQLNVLNDVLIICVKDANLEGDGMYDIGEDTYLEDFFGKDKKLRRLITAEKQRLDDVCHAKLSRYGIACAEIGGTVNMEKEIMSMLEQHKYKKR